MNHLVPTHSHLLSLNRHGRSKRGAAVSPNLNLRLVRLWGRLWVWGSKWGDQQISSQDSQTSSHNQLQQLQQLLPGNQRSSRQLSDSLNLYRDSKSDSLNSLQHLPLVLTRGLQVRPWRKIRFYKARIIYRIEVPVPDQGSGVQLQQQLRWELVRLQLPPVLHHGPGGELQLLRHLLTGPVLRAHSRYLILPIKVKIKYKDCNILLKLISIKKVVKMVAFINHWRPSLTLD